MRNKTETTAPIAAAIKTAATAHAAAHAAAYIAEMQVGYMLVEATAAANATTAAAAAETNGNADEVLKILMQKASTEAIDNLAMVEEIADLVTAAAAAADRLAETVGWYAAIKAND